ncbi:MAG: hypothetical protein ACRDH5_19580, partial [bacterium]
MLKQLARAVVGTRFEREVKRLRPLIDQIHQHERRLAGLGEAAVQAQTLRLRNLLHERIGELEAQLASKREAKHACPDPAERDALDREIQRLERELHEKTAGALNELLPEAFATVREACRRLVGTAVVVTGHEMPWDMVPY